MRIFLDRNWFWLGLAIWLCAGCATVDPQPTPTDPPPSETEAAEPSPPAEPEAPVEPPPSPKVPLEQVRVPGGSFIMGCMGSTKGCSTDEAGRELELGPFRIDRNEVTVGNYRTCVDAGVCNAKGARMPRWEGRNQSDWAWTCNWGREGRDSRPMNCVTWRQARTYCEWLGLRLPTEEQWEKAARGSDGRRYPWGNEWPAGERRANVADQSLGEQLGHLPHDREIRDGYVATSPVGRFRSGRSPSGALDMLGNVWEWTDSWYGPAKQKRVIRGGSWLSTLEYSRSSNRNRYRPDERAGDLGFRCARGG